MDVRTPEGFWRAPVADVEIPDIDLFSLLFDDLSPADAERTAAFEHATGVRLTMGEVKQQAEAFATWLAARGVGPGSSVGIFMPNCPAYLPAFHGIIRSGAAVTPISAAYVAHEVAGQLQATTASALVVHAALLGTAEAAASQIGLAADALIVVGDDPAGHTPWDAVAATEPQPPQLAIDPATHVACLPFSSGTSGLPKAVQLTHRNLVANLTQFDAVINPIASTCGPFVCFLPYSHIYGLTTMLNYGLLLRQTQLTMASFDATAFLTIIATQRPGLLFVVPPVAAFLARHPAVANLDTSSVELIVSGAAPLDAATGNALRDRLGVRVIQGYGMTELSPVTHVMRPDDPDGDLGTIGHAVPNLTFRVVDPATGRDVADPAPGGESTPGELWCAGPNAMLGYLGAPESDTVKDADGWIHTGDQVVVSSEGVVRIVGRIKELIKRRGMQVAPAELEGLLTEHPAVADAGVYGVDSRTPGEQIPHAAIVWTPGAEASSSDIIAWIAARVAAHKRLGGVHVVPAIPRSASGKILRAQLPEAVERAR